MAVKLPLAVRKNLRDEYESGVAKLQERLKAATGEDYILEPNIDGIYAVAEGTDQAARIGSILSSYFNEAVDGIERITDKGKATMAVEVFNSLVPNRKFAIAFDKEAFNYCGARFQDGDYQIVIHPEQLWCNTSNVNEYLDRKINMAQFKGKGELPLGVRQAEQETLLPAIKKAGDKMKKLFNKEYTFEYDLLAVYKERFEKTAAQEYSEEDWFRSYGSSHVPNMISEYFTDLADGLEYYKFGSDDLLQEAFVESSESGVIVFKLVPELKSGLYNDIEFEDGKVFIITTADRFGVNMGTNIAAGIIDKL